MCKGPTTKMTARKTKANGAARKRDSIFFECYEIDFLRLSACMLCVLEDMARKKTKQKETAATSGVGRNSGKL